MSLITRGALMPWRTRDPLEVFRREFDRMFDRFDRFFGESHPTLGSGEVSWVPEYDLCETDKDYVVAVELPGIEEKDVRVEVRDHCLTIHGEKKEEKESKGARYLYRSRSLGMFERAITLPSDVNAEKVRARYRKGLLEIVLPKSEAAVSKAVPIELGEK